MSELTMMTAMPCRHGLLNQWRGGVFIVRRQNDGCDFLIDDILDHAHLAVNVRAALGCQHERCDAALCGFVLGAFADGDVVVEFRRWRHVGDFCPFGAAEAFDRRLRFGFQRLGRRIVPALAPQRSTTNPP